MREITLENIYSMNYNATVLNSLKQVWTSGSFFDCIDKPKKQHMFFYLVGANAEYIMKNGRKIFARRGNIVYIPEECEYKVVFSDCDENCEYNTIPINFKLFDENGEPFKLSSEVKIYNFNNDDNIIETAFYHISDKLQQSVYSPAKIKSLFYDLLWNMSGYYRDKKIITPKYSIIAEGIRALETQNINEIKVCNLAKICNVSDVYFRKLFKEYSGVSPREYKINALIEQSKTHLRFSNKSVNEISDILGFANAAYFCRLFKKKTGMTPSQYTNATP